MDRESSARPGTNRPVISRMSAVPSSDRPITQHGLSGLRPAQTPSTGVSRVYRDKRYYVSLVQGHVAKIHEELAKLGKIISKYKATSANRLEIRRAAEETAKRYAHNQEQLNTLNTALDLHMSRTKHENIVGVTAGIKEKNGQLVENLDNLFGYKKRREDKIASINSDIAEEEQKLQDIIDALPEEQKQQYRESVVQNEKYIEQINTIQQEIKHIKEMIKKYEQNIALSGLKQRKLVIMENLAHSKRQRDRIYNHMRELVTPEQKREMLLQQVKNDKSDLEGLLEMETSLTEKLESKQARVNELDYELSSKNDRHLKKHKELRVREELMNKLIESFDEKYGELKSKMDSVQLQIIIALQYMSEPTADLNFEELDNIQTNINQQSPKGLPDEYKMICSRITRLKGFKEKYTAETLSLMRKKNQMEEELETFKNVDGKREELIEQRDTATEQQVALKNVLDTTKSAVEEAERVKKEIDEKLNVNELYHQINELEKQIENVEKENEEASDILKNAEPTAQFEKMMKELEDLVHELNSKLTRSLESKKTVGK